MNNKILIFNWKTNPKTKKEALFYLSDLQKTINFFQKKKINLNIIISPSAFFLDSMIQKNKNKKIEFSGQNIFFGNLDSIMGEISPIILKNIGAKYSIVGHWERRKFLEETDIDISKKANLLINLKMKPIICIGEEYRDKEGNFIDILEKQVLSSLKEIKNENLKNIIIVYEPIWTRNTRIKKNDIEILEQSLFLIKKILKQNFGEIFKKIKIIYGGNIDDSDIFEFLNISEFNGLLLEKTTLNKNIFIK